MFSLLLGISLPLSGISKTNDVSECKKDFTFLRELFPIPQKPQAITGDSWKKYGGVGKKPRSFSEITAEQVQKAESGSLALFAQLAQVYHNEKAENRKQVKALFLKCIKAMLTKNYSKDGTTYLVNRTRVYSTTLYMSGVLKDAGQYKAFIKKWLMIEKFLEAENPILNMDWTRDRLPLCWAFVANMDDSQEKLILLKKLQLASSKVIERLVTPDGGALHHNCDHLSYASYSINPITDLVAKLHKTSFRLSKKAIENLKAFGRTRALSSINLHTPGNLSARATINSFHFKALPNLLLTLHNIEKIDNPKNTEMLDLFLALQGRHQNWKKEWLVKGYKEGELSGHATLNISSAAIHRRNHWVVSIDGNRAPIKGIEMYANPGSPRSFMKNSCMGSIQIIKRRFQGKNSGYRSSGWDHNHYPGVTARFLPLHELITLRLTDQVRNNSSFAQGTSLGQNGMWAMIVTGKEELCRKSVFCFDNRITVMTTGIKANSDKPVHTTLFQSALQNKKESTGLGRKCISTFPFKSTSDLSKPLILRDHLENTYYVHSSIDSVLKIFRESQKSYDLKYKSRSITRENAAKLLNKSKPIIGNFAKAYVEHKKDNSSLAFTIFIDGLKTKSLPYTIIKAKKQIHIFYDKLSKTSCYTLFDKDYQNGVGYIHSANRPITAMVQSAKSFLACSVSATDKFYDEYLQGKIKEFPLMEPLVVSFNGNYRLDSQENSGISCIRQQGKTIVTMAYKSYMPIKFKLMKEK